MPVIPGRKRKVGRKRKAGRKQNGIRSRKRKLKTDAVITPVFRECMCGFRYCLLTTDLCQFCGRPWQYSLSIEQPFMDLSDRVASGDLMRQRRRQRIAQRYKLRSTL